MRRIGSCFSRLVGFVFLALILTPFIAPPLSVEIAGVIAPGSVVAKREVINNFTTTWTRNLYVDVRYQPGYATEPEVIALAVDTTTYDRLHVGDETQVRYTPHPLLGKLSNMGFTRLEALSPPAAFVARIGNFLIASLAGLALWFVLLMAWSKWRSGWLMLMVLLVMIAGFIGTSMGWPTPQPPDELSTGSATIRQIRRIDVLFVGRQSGTTEAVQPYQIVELTFVPAGRSDPVVAVDMLDADSVPNLAVEASVPIRYSPQNPRWAQIVGASRTFYWKNVFNVSAIMLALAGIIMILWLFNRFKTRGRASRTSIP